MACSRAELPSPSAIPFNPTRHPARGFSGFTVDAERHHGFTRRSARGIAAPGRDLLDGDQSQAGQHLPLLVPLSEAVMRRPVEVGDYTDFYASIFHATNVGTLSDPTIRCFRITNMCRSLTTAALPHSWSAVPDIAPPNGQTKAGTFGPHAIAPLRTRSRLLRGRKATRWGIPCPSKKPSRTSSACSLVNDWSACDIQARELQPLGPFLSKSFATSVSPWVVTMEALAPFRAPAFRSGRRRS